MRLSSIALLLTALAATSALARPALAQPAGAAAADEEKRTRLFKEGKAAADAERWAEAVEKFKQVVAIRSAPKALIALGVAEEHLGHLVAALAAYKRAWEEAADKTLAEELKTAKSALDAINPRIPRLVFKPAGALSGATLEIDGQAAQPVDDGVLVDPGRHAVSATAPGKGTFRTSVSVGESEQREIEVTFNAAPVSSATSSAGPSSPPDTRSSAPPTGAVVVGSLGIVAVAVGAALYGLGADQYAKADGLCPGAGCTEDVLGSGNGARSQMIGGDVLIGVGSAALVGASVWWIVSAVSPAKPKSAGAVVIAPRANGIEIRGRF